MATRRDADGWRPSGGRWALGLSLPVLGGLSWFLFGWGVAGGNVLIGALASIVPAVTCLGAAWLLRSWWGMVVTVVVYAAVSAVIWGLFMISPGDAQAWMVDYPSFVVLPGVLMAVIGVFLGRYSAGRGGQRPGYS